MAKTAAMRTIDKAVAAVIRETDGRAQLLVFQHPTAGVQLPKGTIEPDESIALATLRELEEESGLTLDGPPHYIGTWERVVRAGETHPWHVSILQAPPGLPEQWEHSAVGSPEEDGLIFAFHWLDMDAALPGKLHPVFTDVSLMLLDHLQK
ncbi:MAG: NUDIX domain-containing protein [Sphingobium sp.]|nr:NUDIX domain-containing protein [Sphingobium sp.]